MRRFIRAVGAALLFAAVVAAIMLVSVAPANAATCNSSVGTQITYDSYLAVGNEASVAIDMAASTYFSGDHRAYFGIYWPGIGSFEAGLIRDNHGIETYIELNGVFVGGAKVAASKNVNYTFTLSRLSTNTWSLYYVNGGIGHRANATIAVPVDTTWNVQDNQATAGTCNSIDYKYSNEQPWDLTNTSVMSYSQSPLYPFYPNGFASIGAHSFEVKGQ